MPADRRSEKGRPELRALGRLIVYLRMDEGLSQQDLAQSIGTSKSQLSKWERGQVNMRPSSLERLAAAFGLSPHDLMELAGWADRSIGRRLARLKSEVAEPPEKRDDETILKVQIEEARLRRRDLEAERSDIDEAIRAAVREELFPRLRLEMLRRGG